MLAVRHDFFTDLRRLFNLCEYQCFHTVQVGHDVFAFAVACQKMAFDLNALGILVSV